jgi:hypothetical protein
MSRAFIAAAFALVVMACTAPVTHRGQETAVLLPVATTAADQEQATAEFERWAEASIRTPGAVFRLLQAGRDRRGARVRFVAAVPRTWRSNAVANRAAFVARERQLFRTAMIDPNAVSTNGTRGAASPHLVVLPTLDSRGLQWTWPAPEGPSHAVDVCDASPSDLGIACTSRSLLYTYDAWLPSALAVGSTFRIWIVGTTISNAACTFAVQTPELPVADRVAYLMSAREEIAHIFDHLPPHVGSAVIESMSVAVADLATRRGTKRLHVLSDLRETSGPWAFDRQVPAPGAFCRWLAAERLLPDCRSITVTICGVHFGAAPRRPPFDARRDANLRAVWAQVLAAMHVASAEICGECDAEAFMNFGGETMGQRARKSEERQVVQIGTNRGGHAFVDAAPIYTPEVISEWKLIDAKPGRAAHLAAAVETRFPTIRAVPLEADGRDAFTHLADDALIIGTVDTIEATRAVVQSRQAQQSVLFQLVGRGPGPVGTATRLGLAGIVREGPTQAEATLLLAGFETISAAASSRALTAAGDPVSAALLQPMRLSTTLQTSRYFNDALRGEAIADPPLTFFTSAGQFPLVVRPNIGDAFSAQKALALHAVEQLRSRRGGTVAAVALVDVEERSIDVLFIVTGRDDRRSVEGVMPFRAPSQRFTAPAIFTD